MVKRIEEDGISIKTLKIAPGDKLVFKFDRSKFDLAEINQLMSVYRKTFPHEDFIVIYDGIELQKITREI